MNYNQILDHIKYIAGINISWILSIDNDFELEDFADEHLIEILADTAATFKLDTCKLLDDSFDIKTIEELAKYVYNNIKKVNK